MDPVARSFLLGEECKARVQQWIPGRRSLFEVLPAGHRDAWVLEYGELREEEGQLAAVTAFLLPP